ncbi:hypothetical protein [Yersinia phage fHe-Yen9-03]|uniref:Uncharacterized protein n=1 Tax=Yersinia phage fHe-Yen9-03 TaxID=2052743 RepID=A0A2C9D0J8_9CAUD|nr:hypothetical protein [Yersinia phage fHe-Yen9-03]
MGTRNLIAAIKDGQVKVAQYSQWDGYFEGQGEDIAKFIRVSLAEESTSQQFRDNINKCVFVDDEFIRNAHIESGIDPDAQYVAMGDPALKLYEDKYPQFNRNTGSDIFDLILNGTFELRDNFSFGNDSLWCEFAYILNLDNNTLEIYTGFQTSPSDDIPEIYRRWVNDPDSEYYPVRLHTIVSFSELWENENYMNELAQSERDIEENE